MTRLDGLPACRPGTPVADRLIRSLEWEGDCLIWVGSRDTAGYGALKIEGRRRTTHRLVMELIHGPLPSDVYVCHHCDNPPCCNPDHLFLGTPSDNIRDCLRKGRRTAVIRFGEVNPAANLADVAVEAARERVAAGESMRSVARDLGVALATVQRWVKRENRVGTGERVALQRLRGAA